MKNILTENINEMNLNEFVNANWGDPNNGTLLHLAVRIDDLTLTRKVIEYGARLDRINQSGQTALFNARSVRIAEELINAGAYPDIYDNADRNAVVHIYDRRRKGHEDLLKYLIPKTNLDLPEERDQTLLELMISKGEDDFDLVKLVIEHTKNMDRVINGENLLIRASRKIKNEKIFLLLAQSGMDLHFRDEVGADFYDYCSTNVRKAIRQQMPDFIAEKAFFDKYVQIKNYKKN